MLHLPFLYHEVLLQPKTIAKTFLIRTTSNNPACINHQAAFSSILSLKIIASRDLIGWFSLRRSCWTRDFDYHLLRNENILEEFIRPLNLLSFNMKANQRKDIAKWSHFTHCSTTVYLQVLVQLAWRVLFCFSTPWSSTIKILRFRGCYIGISKKPIRIHLVLGKRNANHIRLSHSFPSSELQVVEPGLVPAGLTMPAIIVSTPGEILSIYTTG